MNSLLIATWSDGLIELTDSAKRLFAGRSVGAITRSRSGRILGVVDQHALVERMPSGEWREIASSGHPLSCVLCTEEDVFVGTDDASVLMLREGRGLVSLEGFSDVDGRQDWYAGTAVINGEEVGPPLGVRSMSVTSDDSKFFVNVHVGGIPRSVDRGVSWSPTIDIDNDIHEVTAHPERPDDVIAAAAVGLCLSSDGGETWRVDTAGLHATYCSAAQYCEDTIFVAASEHHFSPQGTLYRRVRNGSGPLERVSGGLPEWLDGIVDTRCIGSLGSAIAIADRGGHVYESLDGGKNWSLRSDEVESPSAVVVI